MGNNHDQYFGKDKRKIIVVGLEGAGKTSKFQLKIALINYIVSQKLNYNSQKTKTLNIVDKKLQNLSVTFFDLGGAQRQRVFWKQQYQGTQGVIFVIDTQRYSTQKSTVAQQLKKLTKYIDSEVPFCICLNKVDIVGLIGTKIKNELQKQISAIKKKFKIFELDFSKKQSIKQMINWLLHETKPL